MDYKALPIGIEDFEEMIKKDYYYVDKTLLIRDLLDKKGKANLFTRPRRFGKTLNLSMLQYYFEKPLDGKSKKDLFQGLKIMSSGEKYIKEQGKYPVIRLTMKSARQPSWNMAFRCIKDEIIQEFRRHEELLHSDEIDTEQELFEKIYYDKASDEDFITSLKFLSLCLYKHYQKKVIILIDEYDVPLENAYYNGFYEDMISFIRSLFESALKTNLYLEFSVITGCLRISKGSIFTGLNNLEIISILSEDYGEHFGFVEQEVKEMLSFYHRDHQMSTMKQWYDGYSFGNIEVYNPWSVINYTKALLSNENAFPTAAWSNTSSNSIVKDLVERADAKIKSEIEILMSGNTIEKIVHEDITYEDIYESEDNLWNFLLFTGYLKVTSMRMEGVNRYATMAIPNDEVLYIYENTISNWFRNEVKVQNLNLLYSSMFEGNVEVFQEELRKQLQKTISYMDGKEAFYHGFLLGLFANLKEYIVKSNREAGNGRYDICIRNNDLRKIPVILELKIADKFKEMEQAADKALIQIKEKEYDEVLTEEGYEKALHYGIAFFRKQVVVKVERVDI